MATVTNTASTLEPRTPATASPVWRTGRDLLTVLRPWFLPVPLAPFLAGRVLADPDRIPTLIIDPAVWWGIGCLVSTWFAVAVVNDLGDRSVDAANPRRRQAADAVQRLGRRPLVVVAAVAVAGAGVAAAMINMVFVVGVALVLALGAAYSLPPIRLKGRPGLDVLSNAIPIGLLAPLAGWQLAAPPTTFPWQLGLLGILTGAALYLPTTMMDRRADRDAGIRTTAVALGTATSYRIAVISWLAAATVCLATTAADVWVPIDLGWSHLTAWAAAVLSYPILMRRPSLARLAAVCTLISIHALLILATHLTGLPG